MMHATRIPPNKTSRRYYGPDKFVLDKKRKKPVVYVSGGNFSAFYGEKLFESGRTETNKFIKVFLKPMK